MKRLVVLLTCLVPAACSFGQREGAPDLLWHYHVLPRYSVVHETGGFAGVDNRYRARGEFDFQRLWNEGSFSAKFDDAEIWGSPISDGPVIAVVLDVDEVFNLEGLRGRLLPTMNPLADVYEFRGEAPDSSFVHLYAYQRGPWMYLRGSTNPPPDTADFLQYEIRALARTRPWADANDDGRVDLGDYTILRDNTGHWADGPTYGDWRAQFGETLPDMNEMEGALVSALSSAATVAAVPEPTAALLIAAGLVAKVPLVRRRLRA